METPSTTNQTTLLFSAENATCEATVGSKSLEKSLSKTSLTPWPPAGVKWYYSDSSCAIACGDCREILPTLPKVDLVLTDPQYQLADGQRANSFGRLGQKTARKIKGSRVDDYNWGTVRGDESPYDPSFLLSFPKVILWGAIHYANRLPNETCWFIWDKRAGGTPDDNADCELAWTNLGGPARAYTHLWRGICRAGEENIAIGGSKLHPFQKPVSLMTWCLSQVKNPGLVADPYCGSGSTLRAAKNLGLKAVGIELEEAYCETSARRLEQEVLPL